MSYFIRKGNNVFKGPSIDEWSVITPTTSSVVVSVFTTRADAERRLSELEETLKFWAKHDDDVCGIMHEIPSVISNNLEYETS